MLENNMTNRPMIRPPYCVCSVMVLASVQDCARHCARVRVHAVHGSPFDAIDTLRGIGPHRNFDRIITVVVVVVVAAAVIDDDDNSKGIIIAFASAVVN